MNTLIILDMNWAKWFLKGICLFILLLLIIISRFHYLAPNFLYFLEKYSSCNINICLFMLLNLINIFLFLNWFFSSIWNIRLISPFQGVFLSYLTYKHFKPVCPKLNYCLEALPPKPAFINICWINREENNLTT